MDSQIVIAVIAGLALVVAILGYMFQKSALRKKKACEIAREYANSIIPRIRFVRFVFEQVGITDVTIGKLEGKMTNFDKAELAKINGFQREVEAKLDTITCERLKYASEKAMFNLNTYCKFPGASKIDKIYPHLFLKFVGHLLNDLEAMSAFFRYGMADYKIVYQSLSPTFLDSMPLLYYYISRNNFGDWRARSFASVVWLYYKWDGRRKKFTGKQRPPRLSSWGRALR